MSDGNRQLWNLEILDSTVLLTSWHTRELGSSLLWGVLFNDHRWFYFRIHQGHLCQLTSKHHFTRLCGRGSFFHCINPLAVTPVRQGPLTQCPAVPLQTAKAKLLVGTQQP